MGSIRYWRLMLLHQFTCCHLGPSSHLPFGEPSFICKKLGGVHLPDEFTDFDTSIFSDRSAVCGDTFLIAMAPYSHLVSLAALECHLLKCKSALQTGRREGGGSKALTRAGL